MTTPEKEHLVVVGNGMAGARAVVGLGGGEAVRVVPRPEVAGQRHPQVVLGATATTQVAVPYTVYTLF